MASPYDSGSVIKPILNPTAPLFFPNRYYHFSSPSIHFIPNTIHLPPPPPSVFVYYPLWSLNPNPNPNGFMSLQEVSPFHSPNPSQELSLPPPRRTNTRYQVGFRRKRCVGRRCNKMMWRRRIKNEVESNGDHFTTVMLRNIPNKYTREMMIEFLDKHCEEANKEEDEEFPISAYDFFYLPMDFKSGMNKGYAFVNFTNVEAVWKFKVACNNKAWLHFNSRKVLEVAKARIQGKEDLVKHFQLMTYPDETYSAVWFRPARSGLAHEVETIMVGKCTEPTILA